MSSAFIPVFTEYQTQKSKGDAWELASAVFTTLLTIVTGITILGIIAASGIVWLLAPGFHDDPAKLGATTLLTRIMFPYLIFISLAALAMGILNSMRAFAAPAFSPVFFNIFIIGCALFLSPMMSEPILGVAIGVVAGGAAQFAMQLPGLRLRGMLFGFRFAPGHPGVRRIGALMVPSLLGLSVTQINITVSTILASFFAGGPTYLFYGMRLIQFPLGIFGVALATAILPTLSAQAARGALDELRTTLGFGLRMILFIILPAMLGLILLRQPIVHLFFEHGTFTAHDTVETATAVLCYSVGLWAFGGVRIIVSAFYSLQDTRTPAISAAIAVAANLVFSLLLMSSLGAAGLALATALAAMVNGGILIAVLNRRLGGVEWGSVGRSSLRVLVASVPLVVICGWVAAAQIWTHPGEWIGEIGHARRGHWIERERLSGCPCHTAVRRTRSSLGNGQTETQARSGLRIWEQKTTCHPNTPHVLTPHTCHGLSSFARHGGGWECPKRRRGSMRWCCRRRRGRPCCQSWDCSQPNCRRAGLLHDCTRRRRN